MEKDCKIYPNPIKYYHHGTENLRRTASNNINDFVDWWHNGIIQDDAIVKSSYKHESKFTQKKKGENECR